MEDYRSASQKKTEEKPKLQKVVTGSVETKEKSKIRKFSDIFNSEDVSGIKSYVWTGMILPTAKRLFYDIVVEGARTFILGSSDRGSVGRTGDRRSYDRYYDDRNRYEKRDERRSYDDPRPRPGYEDIILTNRSDAEHVLMELDAQIEEFGWATYNDVYELIDKTCPYTLVNYGWTNLQKARAVRLSDGRWLLDLPKAIPVDRR